MQREAQRLGVALQSLEVRNGDELEEALVTIKRERVDALFVSIGGLMYRYRNRIAEFARTHQLPTLSNWKSFPRSRGLMSYSPNNQDRFRRLAPYVDKILRGAKPADLPVEQPTVFELVINLETAKAIGLTVPPSLLLLSDEVIR